MSVELQASFLDISIIIYYISRFHSFILIKKKLKRCRLRHNCPPINGAGSLMTTQLHVHSKSRDQCDLHICFQQNYCKYKHFSIYHVLKSDQLHTFMK